MSTDGYTVTPLFFPGGNIGTLAVHGTVNDVSMLGARPRYLTCGFILEEGLDLDLLRKVVESMAEAARMAPQRIKVSSKRQITIPAKAYKDMGFTEYALIEQTDEGLLIKPLKVEDEEISLDVLRRLIAEGYEGEALVERYAAVCPPCD